MPNQRTRLSEERVSLRHLCLQGACCCMAWLATACSQSPPVGGEEPPAEPAIQWNPEWYVAYRSASPIVIDGALREEGWSSALWTAHFVDIEGAARPVPRFRTRAKMLWDDTYLYVAAELEEPDVWATLTERDAVIYHDNDFEIFIDPDGDTHEYYELEINALGTEWDLLLVRPYRDGGPAIDSWDIRGLETAVFVDGTVNDPADRDSGWTVEIALPWSVLEEAARRPAPPADGDQWRVNFSRVQWRVEVSDGKYFKLDDNPPGRTRPEDNWVWSPQGLINMHYPEMWGIVQFSSRVVGQGADAVSVVTAVDRAKWELRRVYYRQQSWFSRHRSYTKDLTDLGLRPGPWGIQLEATGNLFEASLILEGRKIRIRQDGRVW